MVRLFFFRCRARCGLYLLAGVLLAGCFAGGAQKQDLAVYDLFGSAVGREGGDVHPVSRPSEPSLVLRLAEVQAPAWLNTTDMQYRQAYAEPARRQVYAESRWAAPPAELLEQVVARQGRVFRGRYESGGCQLHLYLEEFIQRFDAPEQSRSILEVRAALLAPGHAQAIERRSFRFAVDAGSDARRGVSGFVVATGDFSRSLNDWLAEMARDRPGAVARCHG